VHAWPAGRWAGRGCGAWQQWRPVSLPLGWLVAAGLRLAPVRADRPKEVTGRHVGQLAVRMAPVLSTSCPRFDCRVLGTNRHMDRIGHRPEARGRETRSTRGTVLIAGADVSLQEHSLRDLSIPSILGIPERLA
jgi:hypothetical protein